MSEKSNYFKNEHWNFYLGPQNLMSETELNEIISFSAYFFSFMRWSLPHEEGNRTYLRGIL